MSIVRIAVMLVCAGSCGMAAASTVADHPHRHSGKGTAIVTWNAPAENGDGTALSNLAGYQIDYGTDSNSLTNSIQVPSAGATSYTLSTLPAGTWYFTVRAYTNTGLTSDGSNVASKQIK